ncbi:DUF2254 domain-containing protein [Halobacillus fulvus]|nr:DUF2254 domain-containing protein [Halobacillus fulvus]
MNKERVWVNIRDSFWFLPALYSLWSFLMVIATSLIDEWVVPQIEGSLPPVLFMGKSVAQTLYGALITSILTMTTISFSTIMVVLTTYTTQFSPRTLQDFMKSRVTQHVLGVYSFGFVFVLLNLALIGSEDSQALLSPLITVVVSIICLAFFILFIHHSSRFVQVNNLIATIRDNTAVMIQKTFEEKEFKEAVDWDPSDLEGKRKADFREVLAEKNGYLQSVQFKAIINWAQNHDLLIESRFHIGDYIQKGIPLYRYWSQGEAIEEKEGKEGLAYLLIGNERTDIQDIEFSIQKLVEIAVKAISPGINDPHTAVNCINRIGSLLNELAEVYEPYRYYADEEGELRLVMEPRLYEDYLYKSFYLMRIYGCEDLSVMNGVLEALYKIALAQKEKVGSDVWRFAVYIVESVKISELDELDYERFRNQVQKVADACGEESDLERKRSS